MSEERTLTNASRHLLVERALLKLSSLREQLNPEGFASVRRALVAIHEGEKRPSYEDLGVTLLFLLKTSWTEDESIPVSRQLLLHRSGDRIECCIIERSNTESILIGASEASLGQAPASSMMLCTANALKKARLLPNEVDEIWPGSGPWSSSAMQALSREFPNAKIYPKSKGSKRRQPTSQGDKISLFLPDSWSKP